MIANKVKLVVWDLDDTFWQGTLLEGGIAPIDANAATVIELSKRGILNSICSKNDPEAAKAKLTELGVWDYFVFPAISFNPKGKAIAEMIEGAALRAENVLFLDDNPSNLEEAKFFNPGIMAAHPSDVLDTLLEHPHCTGKPDPELTRLKQYRFLQKKVEEKSASSLSNEEFLRASNIRLTIDYDVEANFHRVVELINRTNQLNYTKKRLETPDDVAEFRRLLAAFGTYAGCVHAVDNYGDYGLVGFFLAKRNRRGSRLFHFAFSCRTMNMGIEQFIYEMLGRPRIDIAEPVSYGLDTHRSIDWITSGDSSDEAGASSGAGKLVLLGTCDILQVASYCSRDRLEFVNVEKNGVTVRYDDPGFVLSDRAALRDSEPMRALGYWTYEDAVRFDEGIASADLIVLAFFMLMNCACYRTPDSIELWPQNATVEKLRARDPEGFDRNFARVETDFERKLARMAATFDAIAERSKSASRIFAFSAQIGRLEGPQRSRRIQFNEFCKVYCSNRRHKFHYIDVDAVAGTDHLAGQTHLNRTGYFLLARHILDIADAKPASAADLTELQPTLA